MRLADWIQLMIGSWSELLWHNTDKPGGNDESFSGAIGVSTSFSTVVQGFVTQLVHRFSVIIIWY